MKVVVLSYNHPDLTERTVESVRKLLAESEIILVHNGSRPEHQIRLFERFPRISHLVLEQNRGFPGGANAGLQKAFATDEWALFLTNDCLLKTFEVPKCGPALIAPLIWGRKEGRVDSLGAQFRINSAHLSHCKSEIEFERASQKYVPGTAFWMHREVFEKTGGFDEKLEMFWEDVDLSLRAEELGFPLLVDASTKILHAIGKTTHKNPHYTTYLFQRNRKKISLKYTDNPTAVYFNLWSSWSQMGFHHLRKGNWDRLSLLVKAIQD